MMKLKRGGERSRRRKGSHSKSHQIRNTRCTHTYIFTSLFQKFLFIAIIIFQILTGHCRFFWNSIQMIRFIRFEFCFRFANRLCCLFTMRANVERAGTSVGHVIGRGLRFTRARLCECIDAARTRCCNALKKYESF